MSKCQGCGVEIPTTQLSGLGTCPKCVRAWINDYKAYHKKSEMFSANTYRKVGA